MMAPIILFGLRPQTQPYIRLELGLQNGRFPVMVPDFFVL